jgi:hypothetical protein
MTGITSTLWPNQEEHFYRDRLIEPFTQAGLTCVATALGSLTGKGPEWPSKHGWGTLKVVCRNSRT